VPSPAAARAAEPPPADGRTGLLDLTALGRQEEWEKPKGRAAKFYPPDAWLFLTGWRRADATVTALAVRGAG